MKQKKPLEMPSQELLEADVKRVRYRKRYKNVLRSTVYTLVVVAAAAVLAATIWLPVLQIYGSSLSPTLERGQIVISVKNKHLKTGDIVAFWQGNKLLVKRVIAGPGQWVDIDAGGVVTVDGQTIDEPYLKEVSLGNCDIELPHQVAESHWFFMGDTRATSVDSSTASIGDVSEDQIEGQIVFRIWPLNAAGSMRQN